MINEYVAIKGVKKQKQYIKDITDAAKDKSFDGYDMLIGDLQKL